MCCQGNHFPCLPFVTSFMFYVMLCCLYWHRLTKLAQCIHSIHFTEIHLISIFLFSATFKTTRLTLRWKQGLRLLPLRHSSILLAADTLLGARVPHIVLDTLFNPTTVEVKNRLRSQLTSLPPSCTRTQSLQFGDSSISLRHPHMFAGMLQGPHYRKKKKKWPGSTYARWQL